MIEVRTSPVIDPPWLTMEPLRLGHLPPGLPTPREYVLVSKDGIPFLRVDHYGEPDEQHLRDEIVDWCGWLVIGTGERVHMIDIASLEHREHRLGSGFSKFWIDPAFLLAITREYVVKLGPDGGVLWSSRPEGSGGGLEVGSVASGVIRGEAEWELGEAWRPFELELESGVAR